MFQEPEAMRPLSGGMGVVREFGGTARTGRVTAPRVLVCDRETGPLERLLAPTPAAVVTCDSLEQALRESTRQPFDVAFVGMHEHSNASVGLLQLLRRTMPRTPLVLMLEDPSPAARLATLAVRPFYVAVPPVADEEFRAVMTDALAAARRQN